MNNQVHKFSTRLAGLCFLALTLGSPVCSGARLPVLDYQIDLTQFASAPVIFRGVVIDVSLSPNVADGTGANARFQVDRWYRKGANSLSSVRFRPYEKFWAANGHACLDFTPGSYWIVFGNESNGLLELADDCTGAARVSGLLGQQLTSGGVAAQMESDFTAGLEDASAEARIFSIQCLGGLKSPSTRSALHRVIEGGSPAEHQWAVYAALRSGDSTVLPAARDMLLGRELEIRLASAIAFQTLQLRGPEADLILIEIAEAASIPQVRALALQALCFNPRNLQSVGSHLADPDEMVRHAALDGMCFITSAPECALPKDA